MAIPEKEAKREGVPATELNVVAEAREQLAAIEHERWADWQQWVHSQCKQMPNGDYVIPALLVKRWQRQIGTPYKRLSESEKQSDREQVDRYWPLIQQVSDQRVREARREEILDSISMLLGLVLSGSDYYVPTVSTQEPTPAMVKATRSEFIQAQIDREQGRLATQAKKEAKDER